MAVINPLPRSDPDLVSEHALRARRYREAAYLRSLASHPPANRMTVDGVTLAWRSSRWVPLFSDWEDPDTGEIRNVGPVHQQFHTVTLYAKEELTGIAKFACYRFDEAMFADTFIYAADGVSQELYNFSEGLASVLRMLDTDDDAWIEAGSNVVEFHRLVMPPQHAGTATWAAPIRTFIADRFKRTESSWHHALILCAFPLEFQNARTLNRGDDAIARRRRAMLRHYERCLSVRATAETEDGNVWMGRLL